MALTFALFWIGWQPNIAAANQAQETFDKLAALEQRLAGEVDFDYLFGLAALKAEKPAYAVLALERVILTDPGHDDAKLALATAYLRSGDLIRLQDILQAIDPNLLSPSARTTWQQLLQQLTLLSSLHSRSQNRAPSWQGTLRLSLGYDDNVSSGVAAEELTSMWWLSSSDIESMTRKSDIYTQLQGTLQYRHPLGDGLTAHASGLVEQRLLRQADEEADSHLKLGAGLQWKRGEQSLLGHLAWSTLWQPDSKPIHRPSLLLQWQQRWSRSQQSALFGQSTYIDYQEDRSQNAWQWLVGVSHRQLLSLPRPGSRLRLGLHSGHYSPEAASQAANDYKMFGLSLNGETPLQKDKLWLFARSALERRLYEADSSGHAQRDTRLDLGTGLLWRVDKQHDITLRLDHNQTHSTSVTDRTTQLVLGVTYQWRF
uniref:Uncharacterized protein n=1 Tax=Magnetococcus massalia (strain MO-1) TaxID=451514 RepID=A0A1S7LFF6_MAGMO|nr:Protein of unknown function [Candidatus Magnetococcus massalia]